MLRCSIMHGSAALPHCSTRCWHRKPNDGRSVVNVENEDSGGLFEVLVGCGVAATLAIAVAVTLIRHVEVPPARVGDIVAFNRPGGAVPISDIVVSRGTQSCVLDPQILANHGGSLVVEHQADESGGSYLVHWAGPQTALGNADCGRSADLVVTENDLTSLAIVAGGFGIENKTLALSFPAAGMRYAYN